MWDTLPNVVVGPQAHSLYVLTLQVCGASKNGMEEEGCEDICFHPENEMQTTAVCGQDDNKS